MHQVRKQALHCVCSPNGAPSLHSTDLSSFLSFSPAFFPFVLSSYRSLLLHEYQRGRSGACHPAGQGPPAATRHCRWLTTKHTIKSGKSRRKSRAKCKKHARGALARSAAPKGLCLQRSSGEIDMCGRRKRRAHASEPASLTGHGRQAGGHPRSGGLHQGHGAGTRTRRPRPAHSCSPLRLHTPAPPAPPAARRAPPPPLTTLRWPTSPPPSRARTTAGAAARRAPRGAGEPVAPARAMPAHLVARRGR